MASVCLNCGADLEPFAPISIGPLYIPNTRTIYWRGLRVAITTSKRLIVLALARAGGEVMPRIALAEATGSDGCGNPENVVAVQVTRIKAAFREIDPSFDAIESVRGQGLRWRVECSG